MGAVDPVLVIMAAGMGSRYGGLKQLDPVGPHGEILMDYSVYDAMRAGFSKVIFVIRKDFEQAFDQMIGDQWAGHLDYAYAFQDMHDIPEPYRVPGGRVKPWGTGQAVLAARRLIRGPFAVINADDYYGPGAYRAVHAFLSQIEEERQLGLCVWRLHDTLSDHGYVSRGVCDIGPDGQLLGLRELKRIEKSAGGARYSLDGGLTYEDLDADSPVSMNFWGFPASFIDYLEEGFLDFFANRLEEDALTAEYLLPELVGRLLARGEVTVHAMPVEDAWYGVTNKEDKPRVAKALDELTGAGLYPKPLWPGRREA